MRGIERDRGRERERGGQASGLVHSCVPSFAPVALTMHLHVVCVCKCVDVCDLYLHRWSCVYL